MIYTVTLNPSIDYVVRLESLVTGITNRTTSEEYYFGGKGINVSTILKNLGLENTALGYVAGFTGVEIERRLHEMGVRTGFITLREGMSRINFKLSSIEGTEINGRGPVIQAADIERLMEQLSSLKDGDVLFLSGSIPSSMPDDIYRDIMERLQDREIQIIVDATGELLLKVLPYHPVLIKPNHHELGEIFGAELTPGPGVVPYARKLQEMGARNVLISMAGHGAILVAEDGTVYQAPAPSGQLKNGVGAGDSMVAGFMAGWLEKQDYRHAFRMGVAAGSASAFSENLATAEEIADVLKQVTSEVLEV